ncbi:MAG: GNAT family N-acetyltransferase [Phycisphaerales bacterium]|nr:MAG: GNAT family N-acetyltransferase [Phycisphaerales bacterium]
MAEIDNASAAETLQVEVYDNFESLQGIQQEWDEFVESVGSEIFLTYDWCRIWWKYYGKKRDLRVFVFRHDEKLIGIMPLFLEKIWLGPTFLRAVKIVGSDFVLSQFSFAVAEGYIGAIIQKLSEYLSEEKWEIFHIGPIAGLYRHYDSLRDALRRSFRNSYSVLEEQGGVQTYFQLLDNWEDHLSAIGKNERGNIRRNYNYLYKSFCDESRNVESYYATQDSFTGFFDEFVEMHQAHWKTLGKGGHFMDWPSALEFHREMAQSHLQLGRLRLLRVSIGSHCLGYQYHYRFGDKYLHFLDSRVNTSSSNRVSWGRVTFCEQIKKAIGEQIRHIDSMRGEYEHKLRLGGRLFPIRNMFICSKEPSVSMRMYIFRAMARLLNLCYYRIWFCILAPKLPFKRRPLWALWIRTCSFS